MPKTKAKEVKRGNLRDLGDYDFTMNPVGFANIRFGPQMVAEIVVNLTDLEVYVRVTDEIAGASASGTATLTPEV